MTYKRYPSPAAGLDHEHLGPPSPGGRPRTTSQKLLRPIVREARRDPDSVYPQDVIRPKTRADCVDGCRPCPFVSCKWNLWLDVTDVGSLHENFPDVGIESHPNNCVLDLAERGGMTLEQIGGVMNVTRERVRQLEELLFAKLKLSPRLDTPQETGR